MRRIVRLAILLSAPLAWSDTAVPERKPADVPCETVADCWLDGDGHPIKRPPRLRKKQLPRGDCGKNLVWLRNRLSCEEHVCVAVFIGGRC
jgi:hypothetical protein